jgi:hypothetical protein
MPKIVCCEFEGVHREDTLYDARLPVLLDFGAWLVNG